MRKACLSLLFAAATGNAVQPDYKMEWVEFKAKYGKSYSEGEEEARFAIFRQNVDLIHETNTKDLSYQLAVNEWADLTGDEFADIYLTGLQRPSQMWGDLPYLGRHERTGKPLANSVDWTSKGAVTPVKNQKQCGSCWAFSTTGALEGAWEIHTGKLVSLSEQEFVDCDKVDEGCQGGLMDHAFKFAEEHNICTEESYPYEGRRGECKVSSCDVGIPKGAVKGFKDVDVDDQEALKEAVAQQPVSIAIEADKSVFQLYHSGVLHGTCGQRLDHGVLAVGYGTTADGEDYWLVKNSWGASWGEEGYVQILRGKGGKGECGILSGPPSYPVVEGSAPPSPSPPSPSPPSPGPSSTHYEKPPCRADEVAASVQGTGGDLCAPECTASSCPTDVPAGTKARPACLLQDSSTGKKYCGLECIMPGSCPTGASCARVGGVVGVCVYPEAEEKPEKVLTFARRGDATINV